VRSGHQETLESLVAKEAAEAHAAFAQLDEDIVELALRLAASLLRERSAEVLDANAGDLAAAEGSLDAGALDRLRLDGDRLGTIAAGLEATASLDPIERVVGSWTLPGGLRVEERRVPIGVVGANFEARPNVAVDVASQVLKSGNAVVLRTGSAALGTVTALVDSVLRPALEEVGLPAAAVGLVRSADRAGAEALVSCPALIRLVILRGSGPSTAALAERAALNGVRALAHAEGGGVLYVHGSASRECVLAIARESLDRLGVCNRLNVALVDRAASELAPVLVDLFRELGLEVRAGPRAVAELADVEALDERLGYEWASDPSRVETVTIELVDDLAEAVRIANEETSGLAAAIVAEDEAAAQSFLDGYRGTAAYWNASTRLTDGFKLTGAPETGINVDWIPGPRGPVTYRDLYLRQYRVAPVQ
jgi:glutamate-5-semialdehyde dehydrogenase